MKWRPLKSGLSSTVSVIISGSPITIWITPGGTPASLNTSRTILAENIWLSLGFQTTTLPIIAALAGKLAAMAVKLKGVIAYINPSRGLYSKRFQTSLVEAGCSAYIWVMYWTLKRKKSISSHDASISA